MSRDTRLYVHGEMVLGGREKTSQGEKETYRSVYQLFRKHFVMIKMIWKKMRTLVMTIDVAVRILSNRMERA